jgi:hypothetical protein
MCSARTPHTAHTRGHYAHLTNKQMCSGLAGSKTHQELVDVHGCIHRYLPAKVIFELLFLDAAGCMVPQQLGQALLAQIAGFSAGQK